MEWTKHQRNWRLFRITVLFSEVSNRARGLFGLPYPEMLFYSRHSNSYSLPLTPSGFCALHSSLSGDQFNGVMVGRICEFFTGQMAF